MSSQVAFASRAIRYPAEILIGCRGAREALIYHDHFILLELGGSSNIIDMDKRIARDWYPLGAGMEWEVMRSVVCRAAICEGGGLKWQNRSTRAENYISAHRRTLANSMLFSDLASMPTALTASVLLHTENVREMNNHDRQRLEDLCRVRPPERRRPASGEGSALESLSWTFDLRSATEFVQWMKYRTLDRGDVCNQISVTGWHDLAQGRQLTMFGG